VPQLRRATTAKVIAHTRVTSRPGAHISRPVDLGAQNDLIGVPEPISVESVLADQIGGYSRAGSDLRLLRTVTRNPAGRARNADYGSLLF
jgi:hypothetical protein